MMMIMYPIETSKGEMKSVGDKRTEWNVVDRLLLFLSSS
jgi:hypothetical protein